ncbi:NADH-quinone oxidoreductase subunit G [Millisia brevis]|uniref:NADH-quinone oxidoreductase subunit G n=1 Tax=Millisia brevis TaxID=264148 RepID=UPI00082C8002|nr:NADH-quinone oxidoreductase subunit G [Millisia brevis]
MTITSGSDETVAADAVETVTVTIDDHEISVPKGTLVIRAAELIGVEIPRFCDHPLLDPVGACRQCLVEIEGQRKPMASCTVTVADGMVVRTQHTSAEADRAQEGVMELLLINHPLDCPVCDKGGECPLQNQAMSTGRPQTRFTDTKRTYPKPIPLSPTILLDRERCVLCARCTRFSEQVAGDPFITLLERGALQQVGIYGDEFDSYFSGNTVQICPVGALTGAEYRFRARPFDLTSSPSVCEHCSSGCAQRTDHRRGKVLRRLAGDDPQVNEEWNCDKGRWAFSYPTLPDRLSTPLVRSPEGTLEPVSWSYAVDVAARGLEAARGDAGVIVGGRATLEDAYAYAKFARVVLDTNSIDFRARAHSTEESRFLAERVAGARPVHYADIERASAVLLVDFEPEEESPIVHLRLRKASRAGLPITTIAPFASRGAQRLHATVLATAPGGQPAILRALGCAPATTHTHTPADTDTDTGINDAIARIAAQLRSAGALILVGENAAATPGTLTEVARLADATGARIAWIPRRAGEPGAIATGALPDLLPGGARVSDPVARAILAELWQVPLLPSDSGNESAGMLAAGGAGSGALVIGGVDPADLPDTAEVLAAIEAAAFVVSLEQRPSAVTERADVVFPVAAVVEKDGTFLNWEGRPRGFTAALPSAGALSDLRVLDRIADEMEIPLRLPEPAVARAEWITVRDRLAERRPATATAAPTEAAPPTEPAPQPEMPGPGRAILAAGRTLLDHGRLLDGDPRLGETARPAVLRLSARTAAGIGVRDGESVSVRGPRGYLSLPVEITEMVDAVVWMPLRTGSGSVYADLGARIGDHVDIRATGTGDGFPGTGEIPVVEEM